MSGDHNMNQTDSGWRKRQIALDKKAENARELGLDYEPEKKPMHPEMRKMWEDHFDKYFRDDQFDKCFRAMLLPEYTTPPQRTWVGLTDAEITRCWNMTSLDTPNNRFMFYLAINAKLSSKNT
jgi:hypothetical protein